MSKVDTSYKQDLVIGALFHLSGLEKITKSDGRINEAFFKLKKEFPGYFAELLFNENSQYPSSRDLGESLSFFKLSGVLSSGELGIFGKNYKILRDEKYAEKLKDIFSEEDIAEIQIIADKFKEYMQ